jgi:putative transcriptional regulator
MNRLAEEQTPFSISGMLLVATPKISEGLFQQSVCLVVDHGEHGAAALLLNRPIAIAETKLFELGSLPSPEGELPSISESIKKNRLHFGGPCSGPLVAIHDQAQFGDAGGGNGIYLAADIAKMKQAADSAPDHFRLVIGHSLWKKGQLEREIQEGNWYVIPAIPDLVFSADDEMWGRGLCFVGRAIVANVTGLKYFPTSPLLN